MRKSIIYFMAFLLLTPFAVHAGELTGRQIIELQKERHAVKSYTAEIVMLLVDKRGTKSSVLSDATARNLKMDSIGQSLFSKSLRTLPGPHF